MRYYYIIPRGFQIDSIPPNLLEQLHILGPNFTNAEIIAVDGRGNEIFRFPYTKYLASVLDAKIPPLSIKVKGETMWLGKPKYDLRPGVPPVEQFIRQEARPERGLTEEEIFALIFDDMKWLPKRGEFFKEISNLLKQMRRDGRLIFHGGRYYTGPVPMKLEKYGGIPLEETVGVYPVMRLIEQTVRDRGRTSFPELLRVVYREWRWTRGARATRYWAEEAVKAGLVRKVGLDYEPA
jgi:hypothetical protein